MNTARKPLIAGNWKMNAGGSVGCDLAAAVMERTRHSAENGVEIVVAPPFTVLAAVAHEVRDSHVKVAAQNFYPKDNGAFTGEVSAPMLIECGCSWVLIGHSERRTHFGETDPLIQEKVGAAFTSNLRPIVCVGETLAEREAGQTLAVVFRQLEAVRHTLAKRPGFAVLAYEPVWAIGTGKVAGPEQAQEVHAALREQLRKQAEGLADTTRILYGGSVTAENASSLLMCPDVDGALVGGASLNANGFAQIAAAASS